MRHLAFAGKVGEKLNNKQHLSTVVFFLFSPVTTPMLSALQETMDSHAVTIEKQKEKIRDLQTEREAAASAALTAREQVQATSHLASA